MTAYSFKRRFVAPIQVGLGLVERIDGTEYQPKRQTIRSDRKRHARPGEELQLYCGMRTKQCFLIGRATCTHIKKVTINLAQSRIHVDYDNFIGAVQLNEFARRDGFFGWDEMAQFWRDEHPGIDNFVGVLIMWAPP